jgi:hypothetical protein
LHPLAEDFPGILASIAQQVKPGTVLDPQDTNIREAANIFYEKGANPRHIRAALSTAVLLQGDLAPRSVLFAAQDLCSSADLTSAVYADYWAIWCCSSRSFFPWATDPSAYPFPKHLLDVVNPTTGEVRMSELNRRIEELRPYANL